MSDKRRILCFIPYYLPGNRSGGPVRSLSNFVSYFSKHYLISIITADRDHGSEVAYTGISNNQWNSVSGAEVFYLAPSLINRVFTLIRILSRSRADCYYFNSFFSFSLTILPLIIFSFLFKRSLSLVIAPRGEFSKSALQVSRTKKLFYLSFYRLLLTPHSVLFQASSAAEKCDIINALHLSPQHVLEAPNLPSADTLTVASSIPLVGRSCSGLLRVVYMSRITKYKNLHILLSALSSCKSSISFDIYGPIEDNTYWAYCLDLIRKHPLSRMIAYMGIVDHASVVSILSSYDLFALPTSGENFGHAIFESLISGTPVLISNATPWQSSRCGAINTISHHKPYDWSKFIDLFAAKSSEEHIQARLEARDIATHYYNNNSIYDLNKYLFDLAVYRDSIALSSPY